MEGTWLLIAAGCSVVLLSYAHGRKKPQEGQAVPILPWAGLMLFVVWTILSFLFSLSRNYGLDEVLRDGTLVLLLFWAVRNVRDTKGEFRPFLYLLLRTLAYLTIIAAVIGTFVYVFQPVNRFVGSFFYYRFSTDYWPNAWAEFMLLSWPVVLWWSMQAKSKSEKLVRKMILGWVIGCFLLSFSRGAVIAFAGQLTLLVFFQFLWTKNDGKWVYGKKALRTLVIVGVVAMVTFMMINLVRGRFYAVESVSRKVTFTSEEGATSFTERAQFFSQALELSRMRPLFGWGPYSFRFIQPRLQKDVLQTSDHPHNAFLKLAVERGWAAALLWLTVIVGVLLSAALRLFRTTSHGTGDDVTLLLLIAAAGVLAHNLIDYNIQFVGIALPLMLFLGMLVPLTTSVKKNSIIRWQHTTEIILAVVLLVVATLEFRYLVLSSLGRHAEAAGKTEIALQWYAEADGDFFPRDMLLSRALQYLKIHRLQEAEQVTRKYLMSNNQDARAWKILGDIQVENGRAGDALDSYRSAFRLSMYNDVGIVHGYLLALSIRGDTQELSDAESAVYLLAKEFDNGIGKNTHFIALSGNVEEFHQLMLLAEQVYPSEAQKYRTMDEDAMKHAEQARNDFSARKPGYLW